MAGPLAVVVAAAITVVLAVSSNDGLVADDYYKQGLAINRTLARSDKAKNLELHASVLFASGQNTLRAALPEIKDPPQSLRLSFVHPTKAGQDRSARLHRIAEGLYEGRVAVPATGAWRLVLEDESGQWRLTGVWVAGSQRAKLNP